MTRARVGANSVLQRIERETTPPIQIGGQKSLPFASEVPSGDRDPQSPRPLQSSATFKEGVASHWAAYHLFRAIWEETCKSAETVYPPVRDTKRIS
eukprot:512237-Rhodomonas_salina.1